jgi:hypothetical protein
LSNPEEPDPLENLMSGVDILFISNLLKFYRKQWRGYIYYYMSPSTIVVFLPLRGSLVLNLSTSLLLNLLILFNQLAQMQLKLSLTILTGQIILLCKSFICTLLKCLLLLFFPEGDKSSLNLKFRVLDYLLCLQCGTSFSEASKRSFKFLRDAPLPRRVTSKSTC